MCFHQANRYVDQRIDLRDLQTSGAGTNNEGLNQPAVVSVIQALVAKLDVGQQEVLVRSHSTYLCAPGRANHIQ